MKFGVLGTGMVGEAIAGRLASLGHEVTMGARDAGNPRARAWAEGAGKRASSGSFADAAAFGETVFSCTLGSASIEALRAAGPKNLRGKVLVDVSNPLEFRPGAPPALFTAAAGDSLAERIQAEFPEARVVKTLNTVNAALMGHPEKLPGETDLFIAGNDGPAKATVTEILHQFGWRSVLDLGDLTAARGMEAYLLLWLRLWGALKTAELNVKVVR
jgi:8-hydroxy-5-deazaflavin:NADPH oxidoreductase